MFVSECTCVDSIEKDLLDESSVVILCEDEVANVRDSRLGEAITQDATISSPLHTAARRQASIAMLMACHDDSLRPQIGDRPVNALRNTVEGDRDGHWCCIRSSTSAI
jgi:hypothetical protein